MRYSQLHIAVKEKLSFGEDKLIGERLFRVVDFAASSTCHSYDVEIAAGGAVSIVFTAQFFSC